MIIVILLVSIVLLIVGISVYQKDYDHETPGGIIGGVGGFCGIASLIALAVLAVLVSGLDVIDAKIEMYQEENAKIESQIAECIERYQQYETEIFTKVDPESAITLVSLYPELKADTLVSKQIDIYVKNNERIKELKAEKIDGDVYRWWLYFGSPTEKGGAE